MTGRWNSLPSSAQEQQHLSATTTTERITASLDNLYVFQQRVGDFIREEVSDAGRSVCYYHHLDSDQPLPFLCDIGCCSRGCCTAAQRAREYHPYSWALALLAILLIVIVVSIAALVIVYWINKRQTRAMRREMMVSQASTESSNVSQISGPGSYFYPDGFYAAFNTPHKQAIQY